MASPRARRGVRGRRRCGDRSGAWRGAIAPLLVIRARRGRLRVPGHDARPNCRGRRALGRERPRRGGRADDGDALERARGARRATVAGAVYDVADPLARGRGRRRPRHRPASHRQHPPRRRPARVVGRRPRCAPRHARGGRRPRLQAHRVPGRRPSLRHVVVGKPGRPSDQRRGRRPLDVSGRRHRLGRSAHSAPVSHRGAHRAAAAGRRSAGDGRGRLDVRVGGRRSPPCRKAPPRATICRVRPCDAPARVERRTLQSIARCRRAEERVP